MEKAALVTIEPDTTMQEMTERYKAKRHGLDCEEKSWYYWAAIILVVAMATALTAILPAVHFFSAWTSLGIPMKVGRWVQQTPWAGLAPGVRALVVCAPDVLTASILTLIVGRMLPNTWLRWSCLVVLLYVVVRYWAYPCFPWGYVVYFFRENLPAPVFLVLFAGIGGIPLLLAWLSSRFLTRPWSPKGKCYRCGYDLRGLPEPRCPECGRKFDVAQLVGWRTD